MIHHNTKIAKKEKTLMSPISTIFQFKVTLSHVTPPIWRRVEVPADITLHRLAAVIICAMGWHGGHLHQFRVGEKYCGLPDEEFAGDLEIIDERETRLKEIIDQGIKQFIFEYDFGDGWEHVVKFEKIVEPDKGAKYPRCVNGARNCPPEDCGGPHGYENFLEAIRDPKHPEHEMMTEWIGGNFDPETFHPVSDLAGAADGMEDLWKDQFD